MSVVNPLRSAVLSSYRRLYRARVVAFAGDSNALNVTKDALKAEYLKYKDVEDQSFIGFAPLF